MADGDLKKTGVQLVAEGQAEFEQAMGRARGEVQNFGKESKDTAKETSLSWTELRSKISLLSGTIRQAQQIYRATVGELMQYAGEVRDLSGITGQTAEQSSRLLQVLDDFEIQGAQLTTAMRALRTQGLAPTVDTLADLSDQYLALAPGIARVNFLQQNFGRSGADFALVMSQGGPAIRERGAAISDTLILDEQMLRRTEELRQSMDEFNDRLTAGRIELGLYATQGLLQVIRGLGQADAAARAYRGTTQGMLPPLQTLTAAEREHLSQVSEAIRLHDELADHSERLNEALAVTGPTAAELWVTLNEGRNAGENAAAGLGAADANALLLRDALAGVNLNLAGTIEQFRTNLAWITGGGAALQAAATSVMNALMGGKINQAQAEEMLQPIEAAALNLQTQIGQISMSDATRTMAEDWDTTWSDARAQIQGAGDDIRTLPAEVRSTILVAVQWQLQAGQHGLKEYQHGGAFTVGGRGGTDRNLVQFAATRGERVIVMPPQTQALAPSYSDSHDQRTNNVSIQGQDLSNPFVVKRLFDQWLQGG